MNRLVSLVSRVARALAMLPFRYVEIGRTMAYLHWDDTKGRYWPFCVCEWDRQHRELYATFGRIELFFSPWRPVPSARFLVIE